MQAKEIKDKDTDIQRRTERQTYREGQRDIQRGTRETDKQRGIERQTYRKG